MPMQLDELAAHREGRLAARPDFRTARRIGFDHTGMRLEVRLMCHLGCKSILDDHVGLLESLLDIPLAPFEIGKHVAEIFHRHG